MGSKPSWIFQSRRGRRFDSVPTQQNLPQPPDCVFDTRFSGGIRPLFQGSSGNFVQRAKIPTYRGIDRLGRFLTYDYDISRYPDAIGTSDRDGERKLACLAGPGPHHQAEGMAVRTGRVCPAGYASSRSCSLTAEICIGRLS